MTCHPPSPAPLPPTLTLDQALDALVDVAESAGVEAGTARAEGGALAAAVAESAPGAAASWAAAVGGGTTQDFFDAATRGRRWRAAPTSTLSGLVAQGSSRSVPYAEALAEVVSAACGLGEPTMRVIGNASVAAAAQLTAAGARANLSEPGALLMRPAHETSGEPARPEPTKEPAPPEPKKQRSVEDLLAELDALIGLERVKREVCLLYTSDAADE